MNRFRISAGLLLWAALGAGGPALGAQPLDLVPVPCREQTTHEFLRPCALVAAETNTAVLTVVRAKAAEHYADSGSMGWAVKMAIKSNPNPVAVNACSLVALPDLQIPSEGNTTSESATNHVNKPCGEFCETHVKIRDDYLSMATETLGYIACSAVDWVPGVDCPPPPSIDELFEVSGDRVVPNCLREDSYIRGAYMQLLQCHYKTVEQEVVSGKLKITRSEPNGPGACEEMATDIMGYVDQGQGVASQLVENMAGSGTLIEEIDKCSQPDPQDPPMISVCQLAAARLSIEKTFATLAACEIFARANRQWNTKFASSGPILSTLSAEVGVHCTNECKKKFGLDTPSAIQEKMQQCVTDCYDSELVSRLKQRLETEFPVGGCAP